MRAQKVRVQNLLSGKDSGEVTLSPRITTLIGPNEAGKTNFLKAIESFNPSYNYKTEDLCYYSDKKVKLEKGKIEAKEIETVTVLSNLKTKTASLCQA
jgi:recombinational DNA repair ATPase RecF